MMMCVDLFISGYFDRISFDTDGATDYKSIYVVCSSRNGIEQ